MPPPPYCPIPMNPLRSALSLLFLVLITIFWVITSQHAGSDHRDQERAWIASESIAGSSTKQGVLGENSPAPSRRALLTAGDAASYALNRFEETEAGVTLSHPLHEVYFGAEGVTFSPKHGGPEWAWEAEGFARTEPTTDQNTVSYPRDGITEQYLAGVKSIEQRFVLHERINEDFVVSGRVNCDGDFETHDRGWIWRAEDGNVVSLGGVTVFDADGARLPATMEVTASSTRISVPGTALAMASYPVTIDPEIGTNDFLVSASGDDYANHFEPRDPDIVYNSMQNEYLIVWVADGTAGEQKNNEFEVIGQRVDADTGELLGVRQIVISTTFEDGETNSLYPNSPTVAYNPVDDQYLVAWKSDRSELSGQRLRGFNASTLGEAFVINDSDDDFGPTAPDLAHSADTNQYLIVWHGYQQGGGLVTNENEIFGRLVSGSGILEISATIRISDMGPDGDGSYDALNPAVAASGASSFLVVWEGEDNSGSLVDGEKEIFGQLLNAIDATETGPNDFRISDVGNDGVTNTDAQLPAVDYDSTRGQFLVVWEADEGNGSLASNEFEIYGQFIADATGSELGVNDFRISNLNNDDGSSADTADRPAVTYQAGSDTFVVAWLASEVLGSTSVRQDEIFSQSINAVTRSLLGDNLRMSDMGPDEDASIEVNSPVALAGGAGDLLMACWPGSDDRFGLIPEELEIFGQLVSVDNALIEAGPNDFRISEAGNDGDNISDTFLPAVTYNSTDNTYLVVWEGTGRGSPLVLEHVWGNRIDAASGQRLHEDDIEIDESTGGGTSSKENTAPVAAYNSVENEFLIAWAGTSRSDNDFRGGETEVMIRRMNAETGDLIDGETRITDHGVRGNIRSDIYNPAITFNPVANQYLIVWDGDSDIGQLADGEHEIYGQLLNGSDATEVGTDDMRISVTGGDGDADRDATHPKVAFDGNHYLVVWQADAGSADDKFEIYGQRLVGSTGLVSGGRLKLSTTGSSNLASRSAENPAVCASLGEGLGDGFLVVWQADPDSDDDTQIYGRYLLNNTVVTPNVFTMSNSKDATAINPACAFNPVADEYVVVWESIPTSGTDGTEIHGQRLAPISGGRLEQSDFALSDMGPNNDERFNAHTPAVGVNTSSGSFFALWSGDDDEDGHIDDEFEIRGQFYKPTEIEITEIIISGTDVTIRFRGVENTQYLLQSGPDLQNWTTLPGAVLGTTGVDQLTDINGQSGEKKFWRVIRD